MPRFCTVDIFEETHPVLLTIKVLKQALLDLLEFQIQSSKGHFSMGRGLFVLIARLFQLTWDQWETNEC
jgi:hypothetical protein